MTLPEEFRVLIITLSDRASRGKYEDRSGPEIKKFIADFFTSVNWKYSVQIKVIPDDAQKLRDLLADAARDFNIIFTTGGTGIGPRDITPDTVKPFLSKEIPGIMEFIRNKYGNQKPQALLSRSIAGLIGNTLIYTLPGSVRAVGEYMTEILKTLEHVVYMQYGIDAH